MKKMKKITKKIYKQVSADLKIYLIKNCDIINQIRKMIN